MFNKKLNVAGQLKICSVTLRILKYSNEKIIQHENF
jgi:hypothetical protein